MPSGIPNTKYMHCKKCSAKFKSMSEMRKHQWSHAETYKALSATTAELTPHHGTEVSVRQFVDAPSSNGHSEMTVSQLITEMTSQHKFLGDAIQMIIGIKAQYQEAHHE